MYKFAVAAFFFLLYACGEKDSRPIQESYAIHCGSCHLPPNIDDLPKQLWSDHVLPEMASRMGIFIPDYDPMAGLSYEERRSVLSSGIFPNQPIIDEALYRSLEAYILDKAPDSLKTISDPPQLFLDHYRQHSIPYQESPSPSFTFLNIRDGKIEVGDIQGGFLTYDVELQSWKKKYQFESPVVDYVQKDSLRWALTVGILNPSERAQGRLYELGDKKHEILLDSLHRPVYLNVSGNAEEIDFTIAEFGHYTGGLSSLTRRKEGMKEQTIIQTPGALRVLDTDIDGDLQTEKLVLFAQGDERLVAIRDLGKDNVQIETLLRFSPLSGVSWFEVADVDGDGFRDIITAHGDNADKTYVQKPYHGIRIHKNDGNGNFTQVYNHPLNGATRVLATDWDGDGDYDLAVVASFPDYSKASPRSFVFLENTPSESTQWTERTIEEVNRARWFLMDTGDLDDDGDQDIVLGVFNYHITPVPKEIVLEWENEAIGLLILENTLIDDPN